MESALTITRDDLLKAIGNMLGRGIDIKNWDDSDFTRRVEMCVDIGCRSVYQPEVLPNEAQCHIWSFMRPKLMSFPLSLPYSTGTIAIASGVVTGSGTTFPSWAANGELVVNNVSYAVATRGGDTSLTLEDTSVNVASGTSFTLQQVDYQLPDLFGGFMGNLFVNQTSTYVGNVVQMVTPEEMLSLQKNNLVDFASQPCRYAVFPADQTGAADQKWMLSVWPLPDAVYTLSGFYVINPYRLTSALPYPMGGLPLSECLREACMAAAEIEFTGEAGIHNQLFRTRLKAAISFDRQMHSAGNLGYNGDRSLLKRKQNQLHVRHIGLGNTDYTGYPD